MYVALLLFCDATRLGPGLARGKGGGRSGQAANGMMVVVCVHTVAVSLGHLQYVVYRPANVSNARGPAPCLILEARDVFFHSASAIRITPVFVNSPCVSESSRLADDLMKR